MIARQNSDTTLKQYLIFVYSYQEPLAIKEQLLRELDLYQEIAVAKGTEYDRLNQRMDKVQDNIEKLSDDIQRLQGMNKNYYQTYLKQ